MVIVTAPIINESDTYPDNLVTASKEFMQSTLTALNYAPNYKKTLDTWYSKLDSLPVYFKNKVEQSAKFFGMDEKEFFGVNLCYDILMGIGCSTLALATPNGPVLARNLDWMPASRIAKASCIIKEKLGDKDIINFGLAGILGVVTAQTDKFALCLNAAYGGSDIRGWPVLLFLRNVVGNAKDYEDAVWMVQSTPLMTGCIITIVGTENSQRCVIEKTIDFVGTRKVENDDPLIATNHYRALREPEACSRYAFLEENVSKKLEPIELLTNSNVMQNITTQHIIMQPSLGHFEMYIPKFLLSDTSQNEITIADVLSFIKEL